MAAGGASQSEISRHFSIARSSVQRILKEQPPGVVEAARDAGRAECAKAAWQEMHAAILQMANKRTDASYRDLAVSAGILADKAVLLSGAAGEAGDATVGWKK